MKSPHVKDHLFSYLEGALSEQDRLRVESHLAACRDCREELAYVTRIQGLIQRRSEPRLSLWDGIETRILDAAPGLWNGVEARILDAQGIWAQLEWAGKRLLPLFAAAAVLLLAILSSLNGAEAWVTLEDYLASHWDNEALEGVALSEADLSRNDVFLLATSTVEPPPKTR